MDEHTSRSIFTLVIGCSRDTKRYYPILIRSGFRVESRDRPTSSSASSSSARRGRESLEGPRRRRHRMAAGLSSVVFLALVSLSPCLAQRLDKGDFTVNEATGLLESPSRRPRALAFPKDSQLLVRTKTVVKDRRRLMNRYRGGIAQVIPFLFFFSSCSRENFKRSQFFPFPFRSWLDRK